MILNNSVVSVMRGLLGLDAKDIVAVEDRRHYVQLAVYFSVPVSLLFAVMNCFVYGYVALGVAEALLPVTILLPALWLVQTSVNVALAEALILLYGIGLTCALSFFGGLQGSGLLWVFMFPFLALWLKGQKQGVLWSLFWMVCVTLSLYATPFLPYGFTYTPVYVQQTLSALLFYTVIALVFNFSKTSFQERLHERMQSNTDKAQEYLGRLQSIAFRDEVTGLPNRTRLLEILADDIANVGPVPQVLVIIHIRLKRMFELNNILGIEATDRLICSIADTMVKAVGDKGIIARARRDEFICLFRTGIATVEQERVAKRLSQVRFAYQIDDYHLHVEHTNGVACFPADAQDAEALLKRAEQAMLQAQFALKEVAFYDARQEQQFVRRHLLFGKLHQALQGNALSLHYQGQIDFATDRVVGVEALARWHDPLNGFISPAEFIPIAEKSGLIKPFTLWVLRTAFGQLAAWRQIDLDITLSVNLSARSVIDPDLVGDIQDMANEFNLPPDCIMLELTESSFVDSPDVAMETICRLHQLGFRQSIDDFGTGYSSLSYLKNLKVDELKIDQSFVRSLGNVDGSQAIVQSTIQLAHNLNLKVVAEGIETPQIEQQLRAMGCDYGQGYLFCKPMPAKDFYRWAQQWNVAADQKLRTASMNLLTNDYEYPT
jgi:diguanylate cyclase (GGDEF)-like protein